MSSNTYQHTDRGGIWTSQAHLLPTPSCFETTRQNLFMTFRLKATCLFKVLLASSLKTTSGCQSANDLEHWLLALAHSPGWSRLGYLVFKTVFQTRLKRITKYFNGKYRFENKEQPPLAGLFACPWKLELPSWLSALLLTVVFLSCSRRLGNT